MKNLMFLTLFAFLSFGLAAQEGTAPYKTDKKLPVFTLEQPGNKSFSTNSLRKDVPTIIIFFSPGCDHCIDQFESMQKRMNDLKKYQIVMATFQPLEELAEFNTKYQIAKYANIFTGRDANYFLPPFFDIHNFPYMAFYNKSAQLTGVFEGNLTVDNMIKKLQ